MAYFKRETVTIVSAADGSGTGYTAAMVSGYVQAVVYDKTDYADTVDIAITGETNGETVLALANQTTSGRWRPQNIKHDSADGTTEGTSKSLKPCIVNERVKIVIAQAGDTKTGAFTIIWG